MRGKSIALLMLALGCGLVAAIGITQVLAKRNTEPSDVKVMMQPVLVAAKDIAMGRVIKPENVKVESWPKDKIPMGTLTKVEEAAGHRARGLIVAGEPIVEKKLRLNDLSVTGEIPKGYRVVSVKVDSVSSSSGLIMPGDRVDVLVSLTRNTSHGILETKTLTILQDIRVFAVNDDVELNQEKNSKEQRSFEARTISLLVTPKQAAQVTLATELGRIRLVMRPLDEDIQAENASAKPSELIGPSMKGDRRKEDLGREALSHIFNPPPKQTKAAPTLVTPHNTWKIRLLQPNSIEEIVLKEDRTDKSLKGGVWRMSDAESVISTGGGSKNRSSEPPPAAVSPLPPPPAPPGESASAGGADSTDAQKAVDVLTKIMQGSPAPETGKTD